jgi:hypothetical protein
MLASSKFSYAGGYSGLLKVETGLGEGQSSWNVFTDFLFLHLDAESMRYGLSTAIQSVSWLVS